MSGQKGRDVLLKISDGAQAPSFITLAGIRANSIELNAQSVETTSAESVDGWRELLIGAGVKTARIEGRGVFKDTASDVRMREVFFTDARTYWQVIVPGLGRFTGPFQITQLVWGGDFAGEATFAIELNSAGPLDFEGDA